MGGGWGAGQEVSEWGGGTGQEVPEWGGRGTGQEVSE